MQHWATLVYDWPGLADECPENGQFVDISGDPDKLVLRGMVTGTLLGGGDVTLTLLILTDQEGWADLVQYVEDRGEIGIELSKNQKPWDVSAEAGTELEQTKRKSLLT